MSEEQDTRTVDRRRLLRRAGTVAAGVAGAGVGAVAASPAQADPGQPVLQGTDNNAVNATTLRSASDAATLRLENSKTITTPDGYVMAAPALELAPHGNIISDQAVMGSLSMSTSGTIWAITADLEGQKIADYVHTSGNSNVIIPIKPQRVIDTRYSASRTRILNRSGNLDSSGRLLGGKTIQISLADFVYFGDGLFGNVTVTKPVAPGFLTVFPTGFLRPPTSTINYQNQSLSNAFMTGVGGTQTIPDVISVYANKTTHVILDVVSFVVGIGAVNPDIMLWPVAGPAAASLADRTAKRALAAKQGKPSWK